MSDTRTHEVTRLLTAARGGDASAYDRLLPLVYEDLRTRAARSLRGERAGHTLQATALVHEAWLRLREVEAVSWSDRGHFLALAATCIRRILVDHARRKQADKRGAGCERIALEDLDDVAAPSDRQAADLASATDLVALDEVLAGLARHDARKGRVVELRFFGGLTVPEVARTLAVSVGTVERDLRLARAWLARELGRGNPAIIGVTVKRTA